MRHPNNQAVKRTTIRLTPKINRLLKLVCLSLDMSAALYINRRLGSVLRADVDVILGDNSENSIDDTEKLMLKKLTAEIKNEIGE